MMRRQRLFSQGLWMAAAVTGALSWGIGGATALAQVVPPPPPGGGGPGTGGVQFLVAAPTTRMCDPKLEGGGAEVQYALAPSANPYVVQVTVIDGNGATVATVFSGKRRGSATQLHRHFWDGRNTAGLPTDPGLYTLRVEATDYTGAKRVLDYELDVVRIGFTTITAESTLPNNEWQTVYFMKNGNYAFYATPSTGEWLSRADTGDLSNLDRNDGTARPAPAIHTTTDEPALELNLSGAKVYENDWHNYPLAYRAGAIPQFTLKLGSNCIRNDGSVGACRFPVAGYDLRIVGQDGQGAWTTSATTLAPNGTVTLVGGAVSSNATRIDRKISWTYEYRPTGSTNWIRMPGRFQSEHRIYTILDQPYWATGGTGTQYSGPWVEVLDYLDQYKTEFGLTLSTQEKVVEALIKGYFGQQGNLLTAIEDVAYDCPSEGGDGGATHYGGTGTVHLSSLLNAHDLGQYVNCTDCATTTAVMLSMLGVPNVKLDQLGSMQLRAIWGIGTDDYTLDLWWGSHGFSYHHVITRDGGVEISDACLCVDEDGNPDTLPGTPGFNHDRDWNNYEALLAKGNVTWFTQKLPKVD